MDTNTNNRKIVSISFLYAGERIRIGTDKSGKFPLPKATSSKYDLRMVPHSAKEFVKHEKVKDADPVLTLSDGLKLRVYQGGYSTAMVVEAASVIENHDKANRRSQRKPKSNKKSFSFLEASELDYADDFYFGFDFEDED